jgi:polar amino acid transport system substrate-binding protein
MTFLNGFLAKIKSDGRFDKMYDKWFKSSDWYQFAR